MIAFEHVTKLYRTPGYTKTVFKDINTVFPSGVAVALLGRNGAGKSTLVRMISGAVKPTYGQIITKGEVSWPVGFAGSFHQELTGAQNVRFLARIYGVDSDELVAFVEDFAELGRGYHQQLRTYSSGMRSRLAFGTSMGIKFETYLVDEVSSVGDQAFREKSTALFRERMKDSGAVFISHSMPQVRSVCDAGAVLEGGQLIYYPDLEEAIDRHLYNMANVAPQNR